MILVVVLMRCCFIIIVINTQRNNPATAHAGTCSGADLNRGLTALDVVARQLVTLAGDPGRAPQGIRLVDDILPPPVAAKIDP